MGKYAYEEFLRRCLFKKGDYVAKKICAWPVDKDEVWLVEDIQQIWYLCEDKDTDNPKPVGLINRYGKREWSDYTSLNFVYDKELWFDPSSDHEVPPSPI